MRRAKRAEQLPLVFEKAPARRGRGWGGSRDGAGRKPAPERKGFVAHDPRPVLDRRHPVHVTMRAVKYCPPLRTQRVLRIVHECIARITRRGSSFQVVHFSVQSNHLHLVVESQDRRRMGRALQWLASQIARRVNRIITRRGSLWRDRYHRQDLTTPRQVRNALVYVVMNVRKHAREWQKPLAPLDMCSSAAWLDGWDSRAGPYVDRVRAWLSEHGLGVPPVGPPETWLASAGWKRHGLLRATELPASAP
jgi:putative transposase